MTHLAKIIQQHPGTSGQGNEEFKASLSFIMRPTQKVGKNWLDSLVDGGPHYHAQQPKFDGYHPHSEKREATAAGCPLTSYVPMHAHSHPLHTKLISVISLY